MALSPQIQPKPPIPHIDLMSQEIKKYKIQTLEKHEIRIVFWGTPDFSALVLEKLLEFCQNAQSHPRGGISGQEETEPAPIYSIQAVVTAPDKPVGRKQIITPSPVALTAQKHNIPTLKPEKLDEDFLKNHPSLLDADLFIVAAYGKIIPQEILDIPQFGTLNIHPSLLPKYRGASPIQAAILNGDQVSGITIIKMDEKMDHGPIVTQKEFALSDQDTFETLAPKMFAQGAEMLVEVIPQYIEGKIKLQEQNHQQATYCHIIKKEDGYFDIDNPPSEEILDRMIRAYFPWPTAWCKWNGKIVKFLPFTHHPERSEGSFRIQEDSSSKTPQNDKFLIQMEGKNPVKLNEFLRDYPNFPLHNI